LIDQVSQKKRMRFVSYFVARMLLRIVTVTADLYCELWRPIHRDCNTFATP